MSQKKKPFSRADSSTDSLSSSKVGSGIKKNGSSASFEERTGTSKKGDSTEKFSEKRLLKEGQIPIARMFFSVDIARSSLLKHSSAETGEWQSAINRFYQGFGNAVRRIDGLKLWKINGDELVYTREVFNEEQVYRSIRSFRRAARNFLESEIIHAERRIRITIEDIKCAIWLSYFPFVNEILLIRRNDDGFIASPAWSSQKSGKKFEKAMAGSADFMLDFIGPTMDEGYRLAALARPGRITLSIQVAMLLSHAIIARNRRRDALAVSFDGAKKLRGVEGGNDYPITSIRIFGERGLPSEDQPYSRWLNEDGNFRVLNPEKVFEIGKYFLMEHGNLFGWFLYLPGSQEFGKLPPRVMERFIKIASTRPAIKSEADNSRGSEFSHVCEQWLSSPRLSDLENQKAKIESEKYFIIDQVLPVDDGG